MTTKRSNRDSYRFKIDVSLLVEAESPAEALQIAAKLVPGDFTSEQIRVSVKGELYGPPMRTARKVAYADNGY